MSNLSFEIDEKTGELAMCLGAMCVSVNRKAAAVVAKNMAYYAEHGSLNEPMRRYVIGWVSGVSKFWLTAYEGFKPSFDTPVFFETEEDARAVHKALFSGTEGPKVLEVTVAERDGRLVEIDDA